MSYLSASHLIERYDERTIKDLLSDNGSPVASLSGNTRLITLMRAATGRINAAIRVGNNYTEAQMATLFSEAAAGEGAAGEGDEEPAVFAIEYLRDIAADIVMATLLKRRPEKYKSAVELLKQIEETALEPLRKGLRLFDFESRASSAATIKGDEITSGDVQTTRPITHRTRNFYPAREHQLYLGR